MDNSINTVSFGNTYYSKLLLTRTILMHEFPINNNAMLEKVKNVNSYIHDKQPPEFLKKIIGQSKFFQDLNEKTDVFVASQIVYKNPKEILANIKEKRAKEDAQVKGLWKRFLLSRERHLEDEFAAEDIKKPWYGCITAAFKDPYSVVEKSPEVIVIDAKTATENQLKQKLADFARKLPLFNELACKKSHFEIFEKNPESGEYMEYISKGFGVKIIDNGERLGMFDRGQIV